MQAVVRDVPNTGGETMASMPFLTKRHLQGYQQSEASRPPTPEENEEPQQHQPEQDQDQNDLEEHNNFNLRYHHTDEERLVPSNIIVYSEFVFIFIIECYSRKHVLSINTGDSGFYL
ncbi:hypothetical protein N7501_005337 [Penicillium viridicatum]|nr:hypothetical protein N7501_005337 [Penicillium viridicatum]